MAAPVSSWRLEIAAKTGSTSRSQVHRTPCRARAAPIQSDTASPSRATAARASIAGVGTCGPSSAGTAGNAVSASVSGAGRAAFSGVRPVAGPAVSAGASPEPVAFPGIAGTGRASRTCRAASAAGTPDRISRFISSRRRRSAVS